MIDIPPELMMYDEFGRKIFRPPVSSITQDITLPESPDIYSRQRPPDIAPYAPPEYSGAPNIPTSSPVEQEYSKALSEQPQRGHHNVWRYIGAALAGLGREGPRAGRAFLDAPYQSKLEEWRNRISAIEPRLQLQLAKEKEGLDIAKLQDRSRYEAMQAAINMMKAQTGERRAETGEERTRIYGQDVTSKVLSRKLNDEYRKWRQENPKLDDTQWAYSAQDPDERSARLEFVKSLAESKRETPEQAGEKAAAKEQATIDIKAKPENLTKEGQIAAATGGPAAYARETSTLKAKAEAPESPEERELVDSMVSKAKQNPDSAWDLAKVIPNPKTRAKYISKIIDTAPSKILDTNERRVVDSAKTAIRHANKVKSYLADPDIAKAIGPIAGRLTELGQVVGKSVYNEGPAARKEAEFLDLMKYLILFESSSVSGTRPSWQLINYLKTTQGAKFDMDKAVGNLDATIASAGIRLSGIYGSSKEGQSLEQKKPGMKFTVIK